jgi:hypothetical protein
LSDKIYRGFAARKLVADNPPALKRRATDMPPFQGYGDGVAVIHRALPCANDCRAFSPSPDGDGVEAALGGSPAFQAACWEKIASRGSSTRGYENKALSGFNYEYLKNG